MSILLCPSPFIRVPFTWVVIDVSFHCYSLYKVSVKTIKRRIWLVKYMKRDFYLDGYIILIQRKLEKAPRKVLSKI